MHLPTPDQALPRSRRDQAPVASRLPNWLPAHVPIERLCRSACRPEYSALPACVRHQTQSAAFPDTSGHRHQMPRLYRIFCVHLPQCHCADGNWPAHPRFAAHGLPLRISVWQHPTYRHCPLPACPDTAPSPIAPGPCISRRHRLCDAVSQHPTPDNVRCSILARRFDDSQARLTAQMPETARCLV